LTTQQHNNTNKQGYFSYQYPLKVRGPSCELEHIVDRLLQLVTSAFPGT